MASQENDPRRDVTNEETESTKTSMRENHPLTRAEAEAVIVRVFKERGKLLKWIARAVDEFGCSTTSDDILVDVLLSVLERLQDANKPPIENVDAFIAGAVLRKTKEVLRTEGNRERIFKIKMIPLTRVAEEGDLLRDLVAPELIEAIDSLPESLRLVVVYVSEGFSYHEIAERLNLTNADTARKRMQRARAYLIPILKEQGWTFDGPPPPEDR